MKISQSPVNYTRIRMKFYIRLPHYYDVSVKRKKEEILCGYSSKTKSLKHDRPFDHDNKFSMNFLGYTKSTICISIIKTM